jgi:hypothetical protein
MNKEDIPAVPDENKMEELLGKIQPVPSERFHQKMKQAAWRVEEQLTAKNFRLKVALAIFFLAALATLFSTPQGRAWAQEVFQFFGRINSLTIKLPESQLKAMEATNDPYELPLVPAFIPTISLEITALPGCETQQKSQSYRCQVALAESQLGFDLKELPEKPEGWKFDSLRFDALSKRATISYTFDLRYASWGTTYSTLSLMQGIGDFPGFYKNSPWEVVPADKVEVVSVGNGQGEYVKGFFYKPADRDTLVWDDSNHQQRLAWSDGTRWYLIELWGNLNVPNTLGREGLIGLAESLVDSSLEKAEPLDPNFLYSVADAEEISGFDLKAPTLLPIGVSFSYARYYPSSKQVRLFYGINNELVIYQWEDKSVDFDTLSISNPYGIAEVNGEKARFGAGRDSDPYMFLWWQNDGRYYQMYYYYYEYIGAKLDKEKMVAIAESMEDVDDLRANVAKPYEYVSIYARSLGFDAREFSTTPSGWSYVNVWADPSARCIILVYTSTAEQGDLFIRQCGTDKRVDIPDAPTSSIEHVRIGRNQGQYIAGAFIPGEKGEMVWDPAAPSKELYWQENGLWIRLSLWGNNTSIYDKEELISIAESLR